MKEGERDRGREWIRFGLGANKCVLGTDRDKNLRPLQTDIYVAYKNKQLTHISSFSSARFQARATCN